MNTKRILIVGSNGLLGQKMAELFVRGSSNEITLSSIENSPVRELLSVKYIQADITAKKEVLNLAAACDPEVIINCAAMTNVDACETERELAWKINVVGVENLVEAARRTNARIVHVSSDYIFDGKAGPYTEDDRPEPISYYGKTKLASEKAVRISGLPFMIARTMVLYGFAAGVKPNFALWLIQSLEKRDQVRVVDDQYGNPTLVDDLAYGIMRGVEIGRNGVYNIAGRDIVSRYDFALHLARVFDLDAGLISPIKTVQLHQPAHRPLKSGLVTLKAEVELGITPSTVEQGLLVLKNQLSRSMKRVGDSAPMPGSRQSPGGKPGKH